jgi:PAS domain S-box-containing protein
MVRLRRLGYGAAAAIAFIGSIGTRDPVWMLVTLLAVIGFFAGTGFRMPDRRLMAGLITDHVVALSLWWMVGPSSVVDLLPIVIISLSAFILPTRTAIPTILTGIAVVAARIPLHLAGTESIFPMYWSDEAGLTSDVVIAVVALIVLAIASAAVFFSVGSLIERSRLQLSDSEHRYRTLVEASPDAILIHQGGALKFVNEAAAIMLGYRIPHAALEMAYLDHVAPEDRASEIERMHQVAEGQLTELAEIRLLRTDRSLHTVEAVGIPAEFNGKPAVQVVLRDVTARQALSDTQQLLEAAFDSSASGMAVVDMQGNYLRVNQAQCDLFGHSREEFLMMTWRDLTDPTDIEASDAAVAQLIADDTEDSFSISKNYVHADGSLVSGHTTVTLIRDTNGKPAYLYSHTIDMTAATAAEEALRASELRYRNLFERIPVAMYRSTPEGEVLDANPALVDLMGFERRDPLLGLASHDIYVDPAARARWKSEISQSGTVLGFEAQMRRRDGSTFWSSDSAQIVRDVDGSILYYEGAIIDLSAQKSAEQARRRLTRIIEATPDIVVVLDPSGWVTYANTAARSYFSIDDGQEPPYLHVSQAIDRETMSLLVGDIIPTLKDGEAWTGEFELIAADGTGLPVSCVGLAHYSDAGELARFSAVLRDVSEQVETTRQLQDLVRTKDEFVASVSHELRTPLTAVVGLAQELRDHWKVFEEDELEDLIKLIADQGTEVSAIVQDLLVAARADIGSITINPTVIDVSEQVEAAIRTIPKELVERFDIDVKTVSAWADAGRLRQIIRNLVTNALRYGGPNVSIEAHNGGGVAVVNVTDDGSGIPPADRQRIFDPYFRAHNMPSQPASVGLGLTVSRQLAELMSGELTYEYRDGVSKFSVQLPTEPKAKYPAS